MSLPVPPARHDGANGLLHQPPIVHDLAIAEPKNPVSPLSEKSIAAPIAFERIDTSVVLAAVDLNDQSSPDNEVDPADS